MKMQVGISQYQFRSLMCVMALLLLKDVYFVEALSVKSTPTEYAQYYVALPTSTPAFAVEKVGNLNKAKQERQTLKIAKRDRLLPGTKHELPEGLKPVDTAFHRTAWMGTLDHPTIDGGMINAADGVPINRDRPRVESELVAAVETPIGAPENMGEPIKARVIQASDKFEKNIDDSTDKKFGDAWATSGQVKRLLSEAAKEGRLDYVLHKAEEMGLPASVALVPMVESRYQMQAISPKGAAGPWQIMPDTAKDYGLKVHERFEWAPSTQAALRLLSDLYTRFGSWDLAFAAYNAGAGRVEKALKKNPSATGVNDLDLPQETKTYVTRLHQVSAVLASSE